MSPVTDRRASLAVHGHADVVDALVNDSITLSTAAFESAAAVREHPSDPRSCAWQVISYYYSSYFAANALMRLAGFVCTNFDADWCGEINERALLYRLGGVDKRTKLAPGVYFGVFSHSSSNFVFQALSGVRGGVHIQFWAGFVRFLDAFAAEVDGMPLPSEDIKSAKREIAAIRSALIRGGKPNGSWLSDVRNAVNYRFDAGVWYPYRGSEVTGAELSREIRRAFDASGFLPDALSATPDCSRLAAVSGYFLCWLKRSLELIETHARHGRRTRIRDGALARLDQLG